MTASIRERLASGEITPMDIMATIAERQRLNVDRLLADGARIDLQNLPELLETAMLSPRVEAVRFKDGETGEDVACAIKPNADYIIIERAMSVELVLRAIMLDQGTYVSSDAARRRLGERLKEVLVEAENDREKSAKARLWNKIQEIAVELLK